MTPAPINRRVLLIDDMTSIHEDFRKILRPSEDPGDLRELEREIFGEARSSTGPAYELDTACQGLEGLEKVEAAVAAGRPYALAFVDVRMPPGWDGLETVERLWRVDPQLQVVICTAYSDHPWGEFLGRLDVRDRLLVLKKPFDMIEVSQLADTLTTRWSLSQQAAAQAAQLRDNVRNLQATEEGLREANRELQGFARSLSRDLRSPLMVMHAFSGLLEKALADQAQADVRHYLDRIRAGVAQSEELIEGLARVAAIDTTDVNLAPVDLAEIARGILGQLAACQPERQVQVTVAGGAVVMGDPKLMRLILVHLLDNAWKFTSRKHSARIEFGAFQEGGDTVCFVRDDGAGFDPAQAPRLFEGLQRLHHTSEFPGAGIGIYTVRRALARQGGRLWADASLGQGAAFYFAMPAAHMEPRTDAGIEGALR